MVLYASTYYYEVIRKGVRMGGWEDMYHLSEYLPPLLGIILTILTAFGLAQLIRILHGRVCDYRLKRFIDTRLSREQSKAEVRLGVLELGELVGIHEDENFVVLPLRDISLVAEHNGLRREELVEVYTRALVDTMDERRRARAGHKDQKR